MKIMTTGTKKKRVTKSAVGAMKPNAVRFPLNQAHVRGLSLARWAERGGVPPLPSLLLSVIG
ncbi:MAG: hypothetical protein ACE5MB_00450 [Anaerolineae bacterium]